ncbi:MAG: M23 family metallopeptidase, partial [Alphaproteobacteria bacterium]|nr:M23 family metallopeptidase [Alphaproteobacteria bacterium]
EFHILKAQDNAYSISRKYNVNLNSLVKLNKLTEPYTLTIGQKILLPAANVDVVQKQVKYVVKDKETTKTVMPSIKEEVKEVTQIRVAQKQKIEEKPKQIQTEVEVAKQEKIKSIIAKPEPLTSKRFMWPVNGKVISSYGIKSNGKRNDGINISAKIGTPVIAAENGIVAYAGNELKGLGNLVIIKHDKDYMTIYAHNETVLVRKGEMVKRGDKIATVGKTGRVTTPQLHFEIREKTKSVNPTDVLERK